MRLGMRPCPLTRRRGRGRYSEYMSAGQRVRVSVCAARSQDDVQAVIAGGADAVGVLVHTRHPAGDDVGLQTARRLLQAVPPYVGRYAVTHATALPDLTEIAERLPIDALQIHDDADIGTVAKLKSALPWLRIIKAIHVKRSGVLGDPQVWAPLVDALIFDSIDAASGRIGGTGQTHDWTVTASVAADLPVPVILAGGLTPDNVGAAVRAVRPWAVNVNSGVEVDGQKSEALVQAFVTAANSDSPRGPSVPASSDEWRMTDDG